MEVVLRAESGTSIGRGHVVRSLALARALREVAGASCRLVSRSELGDGSVPVIPLPKEVPAEREGGFLAALRPRPDVVIADLFRPTQESFDGLQGDWLLVAIDDESPILFDAGLLVVPDLNDRFRHRHTPETPVLKGGEAIMLREEFDALPSHRLSPVLGHLLICLGGSDPVDFTGRLVGWLREGLPPSVERVSVLAGRNYRPVQSLEASLPADGRWQLLREVAAVASIMVDADAGIVAGGTLLYEAASAGLPVMAVSLNDAQAREVAVAAGAGAALDLGPVETATASGVAAAIIHLSPPEIRGAMSRRAAELVRPGGRIRVAHRILEAWRARSVG